MPGSLNPAPANATFRDGTNDPHDALCFKQALRWVACAPAAIAAGIVTHLVVLIGNRLSLEFQFLNPDSVFGKLTCLTMSSVWPGFVTVAVAARLAPRYEKTVAAVAAGSLLFLSGLAAYNVILDGDWWRAYQLVWTNIGSIAAACTASNVDQR